MKRKKKGENRRFERVYIFSYVEVSQGKGEVGKVGANVDGGGENTNRTGQR